MPETDADVAGAYVKRNVALLATCQALANTALATMVAVSALTGAILAEDKTLATLPHGLMWVGTMATSPPAAALMKAIGRRAGFMAGGAIGVAGTMVCAVAVFSHAFWLFVAGAILLGSFNSFAMFYRFAAAEAAGPAFRAKVISLVIGGGIVAAFAGPELAKWSKDLFAPVAFAGTFVALVAFRHTLEDGLFAVHFCTQRIGAVNLRDEPPAPCGFVDNATALTTTPQAQPQQNGETII